MLNVVKRPLALSDLAEMWLFIAYDSEINADRFMQTLEEKFTLLATQPRMGRLRPELMENLRSLPIGRFIIFYLAITDGIELVRVLPAAHDIGVDDFVIEGNA